MKELTIDQIKTKRMQLAATINEAVDTFQRETGCRVEGVGFQYLLTDTSNAPIGTQVSVRIAID